MAVVIGWCTRTWRCLEALCSKGSFAEQDPGIAVLWAVLTRRATRWTVGQLRREHLSAGTRTPSSGRLEDCLTGGQPGLGGGGR